jgi:hypothetical protein
MSNLHFWPEDIATDLPASPVTILKEAAVELGEATKGAVEAEVKLDSISSDSKSTIYDLIIVSKALGFRYELLYIEFHPRSFYPCTINFNDEKTEALDEGHMRKALIKVLQSRSAVMAVKTLLAQSGSA